MSLDVNDELCSDEDFAKLTGGCLYRGHFPDFAALKQLRDSKVTDVYTCPRCLKQTKFDFANAAWTGELQ